MKAFRGGVHPAEHKSEAPGFEAIPLPQDLFIPLSQHIGKPARAIVKRGDQILAGELLAEANGFMSLPIHAPVSGKIKGLIKHPSLNGEVVETLHLQVERPSDPSILDASPLLYEPPRSLQPMDPKSWTPEDIRQRARDAGIAGQGGAAFPMAIKLDPPSEKEVELLLVNACECEPYLTRDDRLMQDRGTDLLRAIELTCFCMSLQRAVIGIEDNKPHALAALQQALRTQTSTVSIEIAVLKTMYPQGAEKMLIRAVTGRDLPPGKLPMDVGCAIQNVGTLLALHDAVLLGMPACTAQLTLAGSALKQAVNLTVPIGTPLQHLLDYCGGSSFDRLCVVAGGPMMGASQQDLNAPVVKATSAVLFLEPDKQRDCRPCLRCGKCVEACPIGLLPARLSRLAELNQLDVSHDLGLPYCMECGCCAYVCPADRPLVQWLKLGKWQLAQARKGDVA